MMQFLLRKITPTTSSWSSDLRIFSNSWFSSWTSFVCFCRWPEKSIGWILELHSSNLKLVSTRLISIITTQWTWMNNLSRKLLLCSTKWTSLQRILHLKQRNKKNLQMCHHHNKMGNVTVNTYGEHYRREGSLLVTLEKVQFKSREQVPFFFFEAS